MNVWILCNEDAGRGLSADDMRKLVEKAGHAVYGVADRYDAHTPLPDGGLDLIVAAGGDGTVADAAEVASRTSTPLAIVPLGTANNIAASLGVTGPPDELISTWSKARRLPFDLGRARTASREWLVVESVGGGLVPAGIGRAQAEQKKRPEMPPPLEVAEAVAAFRDALGDLRGHRWKLVVDGQQISGEFLLVEILNIRSIGPNLVFGPKAVPFDGYFDVVIAEETHRNQLLGYLEQRAHDGNGHLALPCYRAREVAIENCAEMHIDDERIDTCELGPVTIRIEQAAITVLV